MSADFDTMPLGQLHSLAHMIEVGGMKATGDVGHVDKRHQALVITHPVEAESLTHVAINDDHVSSPPPGSRSLLREQGRPQAPRSACGGGCPTYFDTR